MATATYEIFFLRDNDKTTARAEILYDDVTLDFLGLRITNNSKRSVFIEFNVGNRPVIRQSASAATTADRTFNANIAVLRELFVNPDLSVETKIAFPLNIAVRMGYK